MNTGRIIVLPEEIFVKYFSAAKEWVRPERVSLKELERRIESGDANERAFAIMMVGRKGDESGMRMIKPFLTSGDRTLKAAAEYARSQLEKK